MIDFQTDINAKFKGTAYMGPHHLVPVYFTVEGASPGAVPCFLQNVAFDPIGKKGEETFEFRSVKESLIAARGEYARFAGRFASPTEMLDWIEKNGYTLEETHRGDNFSEIKGNEKYAGFTDFNGNLREVSAAFRYRIYSAALAQQLKRRVRASAKCGVCGAPD